jgi:hypothetical protein
MFTPTRKTESSTDEGTKLSLLLSLDDNASKLFQRYR